MSLRKSDPERYFPNPFLKDEFADNYEEYGLLDQKDRQSLIQEAVRACSNMNEYYQVHIKCEPNLYTGISGVAFAVARTILALDELQIFPEPLESIPHLEQVTDYLQRAVNRLVAKWIRNNGSLSPDCPSLLIENAGVYACLAWFYSAFADSAQVEQIEPPDQLVPASFVAVFPDFRSWPLKSQWEAMYRSLLPAAHSPAFADEFLYGRAGYIFGALQIQKALHSRPSSSSSQDPLTLPAEFHSVVMQLLERGHSYSLQLSHPCPLLYYFSGLEYLGAAHGTMGILYVLLLARSVWWDKPEWAGRVLRTIDFVLEQTEILPMSGHYPFLVPSRIRSTIQQQEETAAVDAEDDFPTIEGYSIPDMVERPVVHWCHGATGAVYLFALAHEVYGSHHHSAETETETETEAEAEAGERCGANSESIRAGSRSSRADSRFLHAAVRAGARVWEEGLLRKGPGICHGVAGGGFALLRLFRLTREPIWWKRARSFGHFLRSETFLSEARVPDNPHSLFEGWAGTACFFLDLARSAALGPEHSAFPWFELL